MDTSNSSKNISTCPVLEECYKIRILNFEYSGWRSLIGGSFKLPEKLSEGCWLWGLSPEVIAIKRTGYHKSLKILFVSDVSIQDDLSGAERVLFEQTTKMAARGHHVDILTRRLANHTSDHSVIHNVTEWRYPVNQKNAVSFFASVLQNGRRLYEELNDANHYDCINFHQPFSAFSVNRSNAARKIRKVYTCHSLSFEEYVSRNASTHSCSEKLLHLFHKSARKWIEKKAMNASNRIIVLSQYTCDKLINVHAISSNKIVVIPGGIDLARFYPTKEKTIVREQLGLPPGKTILLTIRDLEPRMGIDNLIRSMQDVVQSVPDIYLIIGGTGPLKDKLISMSRKLNLSQYIEFTGFIPEDTLPEYYQAADIFVLPTIELEGFGLVTLEALASGIPVLGTPVGGTKEILSRLDSKFLFKDASAEAISKLIIETCKTYRDQPGKWQDDSQRCRQFAEKYYSWDANIDSTELVFFA